MPTNVCLCVCVCARLTLFLQHLVGVQDLGLVGQPQGPAVDELQNLLLHRLWGPRAQVLGGSGGVRGQPWGSWGPQAQVLGSPGGSGVKHGACDTTGALNLTSCKPDLM